MSSALYTPMVTINDAQSIIDLAIDALGDNKIPGVRADVAGALVIASRLLTQAHEQLDTIAVEARV